MVLNRQTEISINLPATRNFVRRLRRTLRLGKRDFNVCFVEDREIKRLNAAYRGNARPTDVLSFPWRPHSKLEIRNSKFEIGNWKLETGKSKLEHREWKFENPNSKPGHGVTRNNDRVSKDEFRGFLGDIVISAPTARQNARAEGHSTAREIRWLILHGVLHLLGHDHETDQGEMRALELATRERLAT